MTTLGKPARIAISLLVIVHLWAVVGRPLEFATQGPFGTSPSASAFFAPVRPYSQFTYLDHGYAFFAPDPGPSHLFQVAITTGSGETLEPQYPDRRQQWPRLMYHRHFMLAEFLNDVHQPPLEEFELEPEERRSVEALRAFESLRLGRMRFEAVRDSMLDHVRVRHPGSQVAIRRIEHRQPGIPEFFRENIAIDDPRLYRILFDSLGGAPPQDPPLEDSITRDAETPAGVDPQETRSGVSAPRPLETTP